MGIKVTVLVHQSFIPVDQTLLCFLACRSFFSFNFRQSAILLQKQVAFRGQKVLTSLLSRRKTGYKFCLIPHIEQGT